MNNNRKYTQRPRRQPRAWLPIFNELVEVRDSLLDEWTVRHFIFSDDGEEYPYGCSSEVGDVGYPYGGTLWKYLRRYYPNKKDKK